MCVVALVVFVVVFVVVVVIVVIVIVVVLIGTVGTVVVVIVFVHPPQPHILSSIIVTDKPNPYRNYSLILRPPKCIK